MEFSFNGEILGVFPVKWEMRYGDIVALKYNGRMKSFRATGANSTTVFLA